MRNQKQSNKAPRPFKHQHSAQDWSGGSSHGGFIPGGKSAQKSASKPANEIKPAAASAKGK